MEDKWINTSRDGFEFTVLDGDICHADNGWNFWTGDFPVEFEPPTIKWMNEFLDSSHDFLDIGAWVGPTTIYGSKLANSVHAYEPDIKAFYYLRNNVESNCKNVTIFNKAIATTETVRIYSRTNQGDSMSNMLGAGSELYSVDGVLLENAISGNFSLIKMDIEGGESLVLPPNKEILREYRIPLMLSFHDKFYTNSDDFDNIIDAISVYDKFYNMDGKSIKSSDIPRGFDIILCL